MQIPGLVGDIPICRDCEYLVGRLFVAIAAEMERSPQGGDINMQFKPCAECALLIAAAAPAGKQEVS